VGKEGTLFLPQELQSGLRNIMLEKDEEGSINLVG